MSFASDLLTYGWHTSRARVMIEGASAFAAWRRAADDRPFEGLDEAAVEEDAVPPEKKPTTTWRPWLVQKDVE